MSIVTAFTAMLTTKNRAKGIDYNVNVVFMNKNTFVPIAPS